MIEIWSNLSSFLLRYVIFPAQMLELIVKTHGLLHAPKSKI